MHLATLTLFEQSVKIFRNIDNFFSYSFVVCTGINLTFGSTELYTYAFIVQVICNLFNMSNSNVSIEIGCETCKYTGVLCNTSKHAKRKLNLNGIGPESIRII